ncbi:hypothetical protein OPKNFCMD_6270 [Methylobacterium crusticola]|uniref:Uncharacterized protein n=1 Tax=Methylobacterium crusticola TaxID=1697972 RepID=A0ABQ4R9P3_9HYPH|nr:hypothetical protein [Methylobacterium crusticola]GJD53494.1 hypothetical protein OPKNFCMD_6270 [Methylobacterium crusticola]
MKTRIVLAAAVALMAATPAFAQGGSPYNRSGSQAGGPLAGAERAAGYPGGGPVVDGYVVYPRERGVLVREAPQYPVGTPYYYGR